MEASFSIKFTILVLLNFVAFLFSGQPQQSSRIKFDVDCAQFKASQGWTYLEIYFSIPREILDYLDGRQSEAQYRVEISILKNDSLVIRDSWRNIDAIDSLGELEKGQRIYDQYSIYLRKGEYRLVTQLTDIASNSERSYQFDLNVTPFPEKCLTISDIQLAFEVKSDTSHGKFVKNGYKIFPNPARYYGPEWPNLYYYTEIYNLSPMQANRDSTYSIQAIIRDANGKVVKKLPAKVKRRIGSAMVDIDKINVGNLLSGAYQLQLMAINNADADTFSRTKSFFVLRQNDFVHLPSSAKNEKRQVDDEFHRMSENELDELFKRAEYIASNDEKKIYRKLDWDGKQKFMTTFWKDRDTDPSTEINEFKQKYMERLANADARFKAGSKPGWKTDEGRIFIIFGEPDRIDRYNAGLGRNSYKIWTYDLVEGGVKFVFVDVGGYGEFRLVHSTARNQIHDDNWETNWIK